MNEKLKPCPFCGALDGKRTRNKVELVKIKNVWLVVCCGCGATSSNYDTPKQAIRAWNRRVEE